MTIDREPPRLLLAEDQPALRRLLAQWFAMDGFEVLEAEDGAELLQKLDLHPAVDLVVADLRMPRVDGLTALAALRRRARRPPFVLISGFVDDETRERALDLGADEVLAKPFDLRELRRVARRALAAAGG